MKRAVFLDRDGVICEEVAYLRGLEQVTLIPGAAEAVYRLNERGFQVIVVTNQSGVARGYFKEELVLRVHRKMNELLSREGARLDGIYYCPHYPDGSMDVYRRNCDCRKPAPGMLLHAARDHCLVLSRSYLVGDKLTDMECAYRAGVQGILVLTGYGRDEIKVVDQVSTASPAFIARDIGEAAQWILEDCSGENGEDSYR